MPGRAAAYLPAAGLGLLVLGTGAYWPFLPNLVQDWGNLSYFAACFLAGGGMAAWPGFEARLRAEAPGLLLLALAGLAVVALAGEGAAGRLGVGLCAWGSIGAARWASPAGARRRHRRGSPGSARRPCRFTCCTTSRCWRSGC